MVSISTELKIKKQNEETSKMEETLLWVRMIILRGYVELQHGLAFLM